MFSYRPRKDGTVAIFRNNRPAAVLSGMLAERFLAAAPEASEEERQQLMARAARPFEKRRRRR